MLDDLPLFAAATSSPLGSEAEISLPAMKLGEHVLADYMAIRMSLKAHPMALLREEFAPRGFLKTNDLASLITGRIVKTAGVVLIRQRPGTASGVIFSTLEDETGIANIIIWPKVFEKYRRIVMGARLLGVRGQLQTEQGVTHVIARELFDMSGHLSKLADKTGVDFLSPGDEVRRSVEEDRRVAKSNSGLANHVLPAGRNFH
jgi:error-prone DNA polymerase